ncbi:MAG: hypothetical protein K2L87_06305, partial [Clostridiales bacterium]|nr:hypothetical protein [Clostridiales bacterium]
MDNGKPMPGDTNVTATAGGVYVANNGSLTMEGGFIAGNMGATVGGVFVYNSSSSHFTMKGGEVLNNIGGAAGGVYVAGTMNMTGGKIHENTATSQVQTDGGSGIYIAGSGVVTMTGGEVSNNVGINGIRAYASARLNLGGTAKVFDNKNTDSVENNVYIQANDRYINIVEAFETGAHIGVSRNIAGTFTSGYAKYNTDGEGNISHPNNYFFSDDDEYIVSITVGTDTTPAEATIGIPVDKPTGLETPNVYNGTAQDIIQGYDAEKMIVSVVPDGVTYDEEAKAFSAVHAGSYMVRFKPADVYCWSDGTVMEIIVDAQLAKRPATFTWEGDDFTFNNTQQGPKATVSNPVELEGLKEEFEVSVGGWQLHAGEDYEAKVDLIVNKIDGMSYYDYTFEDDEPTRTQKFTIKRADLK